MTNPLNTENSHDEKGLPAVDVVQQRIARYSHALDFEKLSPESIHAAKGLIIDTLGVFVAGFRYETCKTLRELAPAATPPDGATVLGTHFRTILDYAAFVNSSTARFVEANDVFARYKPGTAHGHPSDVITPLLAVAEYSHASGRDFINAVVLAYEVYLRICDSCHSEGFDAATFGCIGIAAATAKLLGLSPQQIEHAVSIAATSNNILKQVRSDQVSVWKALAAGQAGRGGVQAALLAQAGIAGPSFPFLGSSGWCDHIAGKRFELPDLEASGPSFLICDSRIKTRPARALTVSSILAAEKLAGKVDLNDAARIVIATYGRAERGTGPSHWIAANRETADHSIPYCVAAALRDGTVTPSSFDDNNLKSPLLRTLMTKMEVIEDEAFTRAYKALPQTHCSRISVYNSRGECFEAEAGGGEDDLASPKSDAWIETKFRAMTEAEIGSKRVSSLLSMLWALEKCEDAAQIIPALVLD